MLVSLAHVGVRPTVRGGVLFLGMTATDLQERLYSELTGMLSKPGDAPAESAAALLRLGALPSVVRFLVRPGHDAHFFDLPRHQQYTGAIILHRLAAHEPARRACSSRPCCAG